MPLPSRRALLVVFLLTLAASHVAAQPVGDCEPGTAKAILDVNDVRATLFNGGNLFYGIGTEDGDGYVVPKDSGHSSIFAAALWVGGIVDGELRIAAADYRDFEFWPGPLDAQGQPPADCEPYDRIWTVSRIDVSRYDRTGVATRDLAEWPADLGAPYWDVDGDGRYDVAAGDRPKVWGDQTAWWVMNDAGGPHLETKSEPIRLEARVTAFAEASTRDALHLATFYHYELTYRGDAPLDSTYVTFSTDPDLGDSGDDYIGSDTTRNLGFVYNGDNVDYDDDYEIGYGVAPPAQGVRFLETPRNQGMTVFAFYDDSTGEPYTGEDYYGYMRAISSRRGPFTYGGYGVDGEVPFPFVYPNSGSPTEPVPGYWSEVCRTPDCEDSGTPGPRRFHASTGPFTMQPGETVRFVFALVWARGEDNYDSIQRMKVASDYVEQAWHLGVLDPEAPAPLATVPPPEAYGLSKPFPNPFSSAASLTLTVPEDAAPLRLAVYDVLGREVAVLADGVLTPGEHPLTLDGAGLSSGLYLVRLETGLQTETLKVLHAE